MIKFVLMVNKQGQTRLAQYYDFLSIQERVALEAEIIRKCLGRNENQVRPLALSIMSCNVLVRYGSSATCDMDWRLYMARLTDNASCMAVLVRRVPRLQGDLPAIRVAVLHRRRQGRRLRGAYSICELDLLALYRMKASDTLLRLLLSCRTSSACSSSSTRWSRRWTSTLRVWCVLQSRIVAVSLIAVAYTVAPRLCSLLLRCSSSAS